MGVARLFRELLCFGLLTNVRGNYITASGGGIVPEGGTLVLQYHMNKPFHKCVWFKVDQNGEKSYCMFDGASHNISVSHPKEFCDNVLYTGKSIEVCEISVPNVTENMGGKWEAKDFLDSSPSSILVMVAKRIGSVSIKVMPVTAGSEGVISCEIEGGNPAPEVTRKYEPKLGNESHFEGSSHSEQKVDDDGQNKTRWKTVINPQIEDQGRKVECVAVQYDNDHEKLFPPAHSKQIALDITYPPQPQGKQTIPVSMGEDVIVSFAIRSNPMPEVTWYVNKNKHESGDENMEDFGRNLVELEHTEATVVLKPGVNDSKYFVKDLESAELENVFIVPLVIKNITKADIDASYAMEAENQFGKSTYFFSIEGSEETDIPDKNESTDNIVFVGIAIGSVVAVVLIFVVVYRIYRKRAAVNPRRD